jgi:hypothetical protein
VGTAPEPHPDQTAVELSCRGSAATRDPPNSRRHRNDLPAIDDAPACMHQREIPEDQQTLPGCRGSGVPRTSHRDPTPTLWRRPVDQRGPSESGIAPVRPLRGAAVDKVAA